MKDARKLLRMLDAESYNSMRSEFERLVNAVNKFRAPLERVERSVDGESVDELDTPGENTD